MPPTPNQGTQDLATRTREHIDMLLLKGVDAGTPDAFLRYADESARDARWALDWRVALEHWWTLARIGAVAMTGSHGSVYSGKPHYILTERGRRLLKNDEKLHDSSRYVTALRRRVSAPTPSQSHI